MIRCALVERLWAVENIESNAGMASPGINLSSNKLIAEHVSLMSP